LNNVLENNSSNIQHYIQELETTYRLKIIDPNNSEEQKINDEKYHSFILYLKNTWFTKFADGMLNYNQVHKNEWTNNALESFHRRLQQNLTKNPSMRQFIQQLQNEEKYFCDKYFENLKYGLSFGKKPSLRRKFDQITPEPTTTTSSISLSLTQNYSTEDLKKIKLNKMKENILSASTTTNRLIPFQSSIEYMKIPWIHWKNQSCRVDVFLTLAYLVFFRELGESFFPLLIGPSLPGEIHPFLWGMLLRLWTLQLQFLSFKKQLMFT